MLGNDSEVNNNTSGFEKATDFLVATEVLGNEKTTEDPTATTNTATTKTTATRTTATTGPLITLLTPIGTFLLITNLILLITLIRFRSKYLKRSTRYFLVYKSLGHTLNGFLIMLRPHVTMSICLHFGWISRFAIGVVIGGAFLVSLDSFVTTIRPYTHNIIMTKKTAWVALLGYNLFIVSLVSFTLVQRKDAKLKYVCTQNDSTIEPAAMFVLGVIAVGLLLAATVMQVHTLSMLWKHLRLYVRSGGPQLNYIMQQVRTRQGRLQRLLTISLLSIFICWNPSLFVVMIRAAMEMFKVSPPMTLIIAQPFLTVLLLLDGILQPCIAITLSRELRAAVYKFFCGCAPRWFCSKRVAPQTLFTLHRLKPRNGEEPNNRPGLEAEISHTGVSALDGGVYMGDMKKKHFAMWAGLCSPDHSMASAPVYAPRTSVGIYHAMVHPQYPLMKPKIGMFVREIGTVHQ